MPESLVLNSVYVRPSGPSVRSRTQQALEGKFRNLNFFAFEQKDSCVFL